MAGARVNCYLPDELAERARSAGLNLSRLLRLAVIAELGRASSPADVEPAGEPPRT